MGEWDCPLCGAWCDGDYGQASHLREAHFKDPSGLSVCPCGMKWYFTTSMVTHLKVMGGAAAHFLACGLGLNDEGRG